MLIDRVMHPPAMYHETRGWRLWGISQLHFKTLYDNNLPFLLLPPSPIPPTRGRRSQTREPAPTHTSFTASLLARTGRTTGSCGHDGAFSVFLSRVFFFYLEPLWACLYT